MATDLELIREAAGLIRADALACEQLGWTAEISDNGSAWINTGAYPHAWGMHGFPDEARYVARWSPNVALLVADWLDLVADSWIDPNSVKHYSARQLNQAKALAVARAYLGRSDG